MQQGAIRIGSNSFSGGIENVAFKNPDGTKVLIALNNSQTDTQFKVRFGSQAFTYTLPAGAVATYKWSGSGKALVNSGFEKGDLSSWSSWTPAGQPAAQTVDSDSSHSGSFKLVHWAATPYQQTTYQSVSIPNGKYKASVWIRSGGGQNVLRLEASNYGGPMLYDEVGSSPIGDWQQYTIDNINVINGIVTIGVHSNANANNWAVFDDIELMKK